MARRGTSLPGCKLPLGIHRLPGKRSRFTEYVDRSVDGQLACLFKVRPSGGASLAASVQNMKADKVLVLPRLQKRAKEYPGVAHLPELA